MTARLCFNIYYETGSKTYMFVFSNKKRNFVELNFLFYHGHNS